MKVLIISDTHGRCTQLPDILKRVGPISLLLHLGDVENQEAYVRSLVDCPCYFVCGNNDVRSLLPRQEVVEIGGHRAYLSHGHRQRVSVTLALLEEEATRNRCDIVMFGHTHIPLIRREEGMTFINPGSLSYPRQSDYRPTYIVMELDRFGEDHYTLCHL